MYWQMSACAQFSVRDVLALTPLSGDELRFRTALRDLLYDGVFNDAGRRQLGIVLDDIFDKQDWYKLLAEAARKRTGVVEDPRNLTVHDRMRTPGPASTAALLLAVRGLQMQKTNLVLRGFQIPKWSDDPAVFVNYLAITLALVRNLQNRAPTQSALVAREIEDEQCAALTRWLERLDGRPDLLARVAGLLRHHRQWLPPDYRHQRLADYLIARNSLDTPEAWMNPDPGVRSVGLSDSILMQVGLRLPYEQIRQRRLLRRLHWGNQAARDALPRKPRATVPPMVDIVKLESGHARRLVWLGAAKLIIALRRFQEETGRPARRLEQLVPKYLPHIPEDPFAGEPFRYRLSNGEDILWPYSPSGLRDLHVLAGQGIVWSVGEDGHDDGARRQGIERDRDPLWLLRGPSPQLSEDLIYLVPLGAGKSP